MLAQKSQGLKEGSCQLYLGIKQVFKEGPLTRDSTVGSLHEQRQGSKGKLMYLARNKDVREEVRGLTQIRPPEALRGIETLPCG